MAKKNHLHLCGLNRRMYIFKCYKLLFELVCWLQKVAERKECYHGYSLVLICNVISWERVFVIIIKVITCFWILKYKASS